MMDVNSTINDLVNNENVTEIASKIINFTWYDYTLFTMMLSLSTFIGIYFGCFGKGQSTADEYLLGGKDMKVFPIAMSLVASYVSGITLLAVPVDVYLYGFSYSMSLLAILLLCVISYYIYLPVFHNLRIRSVYQYLTLRFNDRIRLIASCIFITAIAFYLPIVIYIPALAYSQATGLSVHIITPVICAVCIFYTTIGGLKAVVYTDTLQITAMIGGIIVVLYVGLQKTGGIVNVFKVAAESDRLTFDFDIKPYKRDTFWAALFGLTFNWMSMAVGQGYVQKFIALSSMAKVKKSLIIFCIGLFAINFTSLLIGLIMYANYKDCDPFVSGTVDKEDQLLPHFVLDIVGHIPGLPGLFIAGIVCAGLSTLSAVMNCLSCTIYEDFVARFMRKDITEKEVSNILKLIVVIVGVICTGMVYIVEHMGGLLTLALSFGGITSGPTLGLFTLGILVPFANVKGAYYGCLSSLIIMTWIVLGSQWYKYVGLLTIPKKSLSAAGCGHVERTSNLTNYNFVENETAFSEAANKEEDIFFLYRITYYYYTLLGFAILVIVGTIVSYFTVDENDHVDPDLIHPHFRRFTFNANKKKTKKNQSSTKEDYYTINKALDILNSNVKDDN